MKIKPRTMAEKIHLLNRTTFYSMHEDNNAVLIKKFTDEGMQMIGADFGFAWWKLDREYKLAYKTISTPYEPTLPHEKQGKLVTKSKGNTFYDVSVKKDNYDSGFNPNLKSYLIITVHYGEHIFGSIVFGYKKERKFTLEDLTLSNAIGNNISQAMTIRWLIENERVALKLAEKQKATEVLLEQEKLKTEFISNTTHEFRTPLTIIRGYVDLALKTGKQKNKNELGEARNALKAVGTEIVHLSEMLSDLVLITSEKNTKNIGINSLINMVKLVDLTTKRIQALAKEKNVSIEIKRKVSNTFVMGNEKYLERLFLNLLGNSIAYRKNKVESKIKIEISKDRGKVIVKISDNGIGISKEDLPKIFERFYRADKSHSSRGNHSGLGLAIVKWIMEIHKGKIEVKSDYGKGTTFTVTLPEKINSNPKVLMDAKKHQEVEQF